MLKRINEAEAKNYIDFAYNIVLNQGKSSYPIFTDKVKTKDDFIKHLIICATNKDYTTLLFTHNNDVEGLIQFVVIKEEKYLQLCGFNICNNTQVAMFEFIKFLKTYYREYDIYFGFPEENYEAISYLKNNGFSCIEESYNDTFIFDNYSLNEEYKDIIRVTNRNFKDFENIHITDDNSYWNSSRIFSCLDAWSIFLLYKDKMPIGAIYERDNEIYGIDYINGEFCEQTYIYLVQKVLNNLKINGCKYMTFFNNEESQSSALKLGFIFVGKYLLYKKKNL